ncbi:hypothetical protein LUX33_07275 [Actinomadura madurae]|nr:hypothetical protein [Actinomadura madurae]MCP9948232.1 hypothetical protein [Actinomadura madurae]
MTAGALSETAETTGDYRLEAKYEVGDERALLTGVEAIARALIEQHARDVARGRNTSVFVSGYQGSPLGGLDSLLASIPGLREDHQVHLSPGVNEELAATAVWGTQIQLPDDERTVDGVVGVWYGKGPGLDRASDAIRHATMYGTDPRGGVVAFVGDDPSSKSSTLPYASDATLAALNMPFFTPRNGTEVVLHTLAAVELSRFTGCWVGVKVLSDVADGVWTVAHDFQAVEFDHPEVTWRGRPWVYAQQPVRTPGESLRVEAELTGPRWAAVEAFLAANDLDRVRSATPRPRFGVIGSGVAVDAAVQAFQDLGLDPDAVATAGISIVGVAAPYPLDRGRIRAFAEGLDTILVVEEKAPVIERQVKDILYSLEHRPAVLGKRDAQGAALVPGDGELLPERLHGPIRRAFGGGIALRRPPYQRRRARAAAGPAHAVLLLWLPAQLVDGGARRIDRRRWHRLPYAGLGLGPPGLGDYRMDPDGWRRSPVDRAGGLELTPPHLPERRRRHLLPLRPARRPGRGRGRRQHHLQGAL